MTAFTQEILAFSALLGMSSATNLVSDRLSLQQLSSLELQQRLLALTENASTVPLVEIEHAHGQHGALMGIEATIRMHVLGSLGDYAFAFNLGADARVDGNVGNGVGEGLRGGAVRVRGNAGLGLGVAMRGGTLAIYGHAGERLAAAMMGGEVLARGDVGADAGVGAVGGTILIGGNAGPRLGDASGDLLIFLRGKADSLAEGMVEAPLRKRDELRLGLLMINASIRGEAKDFRRIIPQRLFDAERQRKRGEIDPNWR